MHIENHPICLCIRNSYFQFLPNWITRNHSDQTDSINSPRRNLSGACVLQGKKWSLRDATVGLLLSRKKLKWFSSLAGWFRLLKHINFSGFTNHFKYQVSAGLKRSMVLWVSGKNLPYRPKHTCNCYIIISNSICNNFWENGAIIYTCSNAIWSTGKAWSNNGK